MPNPYNSGGAILKFGAFVSAELQGHIREDVSVLPEEALRGSDAVFLYRDGKLSRKVVRIIELIDRKVVVGGLSAGERVCVTELDSFVEGMSVRLRKGD